MGLSVTRIQVLSPEIFASCWKASAMISYSSNTSLGMGEQFCLRRLCFADAFKFISMGNPGIWHTTRLYTCQSARWNETTHSSRCVSLVLPLMLNLLAPCTETRQFSKMLTLFLKPQCEAFCQCWEMHWNQKAADHSSDTEQGKHNPVPPWWQLRRNIWIICFGSKLSLTGLGDSLRKGHFLFKKGDIKFF